MQQLPQHIFLTGTGTGVGKTVVSAILTEVLQADYWKPIQCGNLEDSDLKTVQSLVSNTTSKFYNETYQLITASSPHYAAKQEKIEITLGSFVLPETSNRLIIEGAGGLLVPLSKKLLVIDLIQHLHASVILVSQHYLGAINHTLLSAEALRNKGIPVCGIIFNGQNFLDNEAIISHFTKLHSLGCIAQIPVINRTAIQQQAAQLKFSLQQHFIL